MEFGCAFASGPDAARQAQLAESLGFDFIGFFDSPALEPDVWLTLADALRATSRIAVGPHVLIPHLRHPMAQAAAIATLAQRAPGRLEVHLGTGFTGRMALGQRPLSWNTMRRVMAQLRGLLRGEPVEIDGAVQQMIHPPGFAAPRPVEVPLLFAANGPKGIQAARDCADGLVYLGPGESTPRGFERLVLGLAGCVLEEGEPATSSRSLESARVMFAMQYHLAYEGYTGTGVETLPYGDDWLRTIEAFPAATRHLHVHDRHMVEVSQHDRAFSERHRDALEDFARAWALTPELARERLRALESLGATRVMAGQAFPDWERGLRAFASAVGLGR